MNILLKKLVITVIVGFCGVTSNILAMQGLIANFYNQKRTKNKIKYSINLMWINDKLKKDQRGIHPSDNEFARVICKWAALNKGSVVNVWYDEEKTTDKAIKNSKKAIFYECLQYPSIAHVVLRNVRSLSEVKEHPMVFSDQVPIYHTVDLLRPIAANHDISQGKIDYFVYSDLDVKPMTKKQLFDKETKENLKNYGMVMARTWSYDGTYDGFGHCYENSFQIISNQKPNLLEAQKTAIIDMNVQRANKQNSWEQSVYESYPSMFKYFYHLEGCGDIKVWPMGQKDIERYDKDQHGLEPFEYNQIYFYSHERCCNGKDFRHGSFIPTKYVEAPPSRFSYLGKA